jgi:7,8-dihydropterin-6-yl-methyl-4-(beta-D-ribofuranosyl)aminobenzene 5'-phosphate synthase
MISINDITISTVCENSVANLGFLGEWGLSMFVELNELTILFDTGGGRTLVANTRHLGLDLATVDKIVLSHGHKDHTGGLVPALKEMHLVRPDKQYETLAHPETLDAKYFQMSPEEEPFYQGVPFATEEVHSLGGRFTLSREPIWLSDDVVISGQIDMVTDYESVEPGCLLKRDEGFVSDPLNDELALFVKTSLGLLIVLGCAHRGLINTIYHAQKVTGMERVYMAIGGTHLAHAPEEQVSATIAALKELRVEKLGASHCTGMTTGCRLASELPNVFFHNNAGSVVTFADNQLKVSAF